jgi:predicted MPP superfamily phosphohydrolase
VFILAITVVFFAAWLIPLRLKRLLNLKRVWPFSFTLFLFFIGYGISVGSGLYTRDIAWFAVLYNVYGLLFMVVAYMGMYLLVEQVFDRWLLKHFSGKQIAGFGAVLSLLLVVAGFWHAQSFKVTEWDIPVHGLASPVSIMNIPDIHLGTQRGKSYLEKIVAAVNKHRPDIVVYNGDLIDSNIALKPQIFELFKRIKAHQYFSAGNHEFYIDMERALEKIKDSGITILRNRMVETHGLQLIGLDYMSADKMTFDPHMVNDMTMKEELPKIVRKKNKPTVLVHHSPVGIQYVTKGSIDVMLSGHTHGGQIFPGTWIADYQFPLKTGVHRIGDTWFAVSQGAGTFGPWMRLGTSNEIQLIHLIPMKRKEK